MTLAFIALAVGAVGIIGLILMARSWGKKAERAKQIEARLNAVKKAEEIRDEVEGLPDDERRKLARRFVRKRG